MWINAVFVLIFRVLCKNRVDKIPLMNPRTVNSFIVIFLVIAILAGSSIFALNEYYSHRTTVAEQAGGAGGTNAFVENVPAGKAFVPVPRENLTEGVSEVLAQAVINANPDGPAEEDGVLKARVPDPSVLDSYLEAHAPSPDILRPAIDENKIKVSKNGGEEALIHYFSDISDISAPLATQDFSVQDPENVDIQQLQSSQQAFSSFRDGLYETPVPEPLLSLHKNMLAAVSVPGNFSELLQNDPAAAAALSNDFDRELNKQIAALDLELENLKKDPVISSLYPDPSQGPLAKLQELFGVPVAHATVPTIDYVHIATAIEQFLKHWGEYLLQIAGGFLKTQLLQMIGQQIIVWANGGGTPKFISNWRGFLADAAQGVAGAFIASIAPELCGNGLKVTVNAGDVGDFGKTIAAILAPQSVNYVPPFQCTLNKVVSNLKNFQIDFNVGGWDGYAALFQPQNTFLGGLAKIQDAKNEKVDAEVEAKKNDALSGSGVQSDMVCADGKPPRAIQGTAGKDLFSGKATAPLVGCPNGEQPRATTPGKVIADLLSKPLTAQLDRITSANTTDWKALGNFLASALITRFLKKGLTSVIKAAGGTVNAGEAPETLPAPALPDLANQILTNKNSALDRDRSIEGDASMILDSLNQAKQTCPAAVVASAKVQDQINAVATERDKRSIMIGQLRLQTSALEIFINEIGAHTQAELTTQFGTFEASVKEAQEADLQATKYDQLVTSSINLAHGCEPPTNATPPAGTSSSSGTGLGT